MTKLTSENQLDDLWEQDTAVVYKHSTRCPISAAAHGEVQRFADDNPDAPVYMVDVIADRALSQQIAQHTAVEHRSPQIIFLRNGLPEWDTSHFEIRANKLEQQWERLRG